MNPPYSVKRLLAIESPAQGSAPRGFSSLALIMLGIKFFEQVLHVFPMILNMSEADLVLDK
tara:strand:+ start:39079 stop:39261 length:183 start_codon:yes stop_codon:yes gene_type:complete